MEHAKTIAMATDLLAEGRAEDVAQMVDPLLEPMDPSAASTGRLLLHALKARIELVHRDRPERAFDHLPALSEVRDLCTCVRAEVALWHGWALPRSSSDPSEAARALHLLDYAGDLFDSLHDPRGRCWTALGRGQVYFHLGEFGLMREALDDAERLADRLHDKQADRWLHELRIPALRFEGRYDAAEEHLHRLRALGRDWNDRRIRGHATAHEAALRYDLGQSPGEIISTAQTAEGLLRRVDARAHYPLLAAYHAHAGALLRQGRWDDAHAVLDEAEETLDDVPAAVALLQIVRARIALRRDNLSEAATLRDAIVEQAHRLPHGRHGAPVALLHGEVLARKNRLDDAYTWMERAHRNAREVGHRGRQLRTLLTMARIAAARSDREASRAHLAAADAYDDYFSVLPFAVRRFSAEGTVAQTNGEEDEAIDAYRHALSAASMIGDEYRTASLQLALAQLEGDDRAHAMASAAQSTFEAIDAPDEAKVATALAEGASPSEEPASTLPHPTPSPSESALGETLVRASLSVPLVANTWLQTAASLLPDRWLGVYRLSGDGIASLLHQRGPRPDGITPPSQTGSNGSADTVQWLQLHDSPPTLALGVEVAPDDDPDWTSAQTPLRHWRPLVRLALERALLHQRRAAATRAEDERDPGASIEGLVTESDAMHSVLQRLRRIQTSRAPVLITGERGTGKRVLAEALHRTSARADGPFVCVACANMQREPVANRLFGSTDPDGSLSPGAIHEADGGTLVIEDVDALPASAQDSLLHLLRTGEGLPEGETAPTPVDVRMVATTTEHLNEQIRNDQFRPALRKRLTLLSVRMPPLRERRADIPLLIHHFLDTLRPEKLKDSGRASITLPAVEALVQYDWPGNVRQLRNELERALVHVESEPAQTIDRDVLLDEIVEDARAPDAPPIDAPDDILHPDQTLSDVLSRTERTVIERVLHACEGQVTASAEVLGLSRQGLYKKMKRLGIDASDFQSDPEPATPPS